MSFLECIRSALSSIATNKVRAFLTTLGVVIGVMSVILLIALAEAAQNYVEGEFASLGTNIILVTPGKQETTGMLPAASLGSHHPLTYRDAKEIKSKTQGILGVAPMVIGTGAVQFGQLRRTTIIAGVTPDFEPVRNMHVRVGRYFNDSDLEKSNKVCVLGQAVKRELFGYGPALYEKVSINRTKHMVIGIMEPRGMSLGINLDDVAFVPLPSAQQMFHGGEDEIFQMLVAARSNEDLPAVQERIDEILYAAHDYTEDYTITDQDAMISTVGKIFDALKAMLIGIASISLLVGGIGIMNIMLVSVRERTREVGIRKAVGATREDIGTQFLIESMTLSVLGGFLGIAFGWIAAFVMGIVYPSLPVGLSLWSVTTAFLFSVGVGVFFGVYPAIKASGVDPVEALRYE